MKLQLPHKPYRVAGIVLLLITAYWVFSFIFPNAFVSDDIPNVYGIFNVAQQGKLFEVALNKFGESFSIGGNFYRPMIFVVHAIDYTIWQSNPAGWHFTNILLHLLCVFLLVLFVYQLAHSVEAHGTVAAILAGAFLAFRPLVSEAVVWISSRGDLLALAGMLLALFAYSRAKNQWNKRYGIAVIGFLWALASKEPAATLIGGLVGIQLAELLSKGMNRQTFYNGFKAILPFLLILAFYFGVRQLLFGSPFTVYDNAPPIEFGNSEWREARITALHYFFAPMRETLDEEHVSESNPLLYLTLAPIIIGFLLAFFYHRVRYIWLIGFFWIVSIIIPSIPSLFLASIEGERLLYIPTAPLALMVISPLFILSRTRETSRSKQIFQWMVFGASALTLTGLLYLSIPLLRERLEQWRQAGDSMRQLIQAIGVLAQDVPNGQNRVVIVPDNIEGILFARNAQGALLFPPFQARDLSNVITIYAPLNVCEVPQNLPITPYDYYCWHVSAQEFRLLDPTTFNEDEWEEAWEFD